MRHPTSLSTLLASFVFGICVPTALPAADAPTGLRATPVSNELGLRLDEYVFSWHAPVQAGYQVLVASDERKLAADVGDLWDSGRRHSARCYGVLCRGRLPRATSVWWKVRVWDDSDSSDFSAPGRIEIPSRAATAKPRSRPTHASGKLQFVDGRLGRALRLDSKRTVRADDYDALRSTRQTTIAAWIRPRNVTDSWQCIYRKEDGTDRRLLALGKEGPFWGLWCGLSIGGKYVEVGAELDKKQLSDGEWHHVAVTFDGRRLGLYVDGKKRGDHARSGAIGANGSAPAFIGSFGGNREHFQGDVDDVRVYTRALSEGDLGKLAAGDVAVQPKALAGRWSFDGDVANEATYTPPVPRDRIAIVGGSLVANMERYGYFETALTARWPHHDISFRNLGWPADDVFGTARGEFESGRGPGTWRPESGSPPAGYGQLLGQVRIVNPSTILVGYGAEAAYVETDEQMENFQAAYVRLIKDLEARSSKLILLTPVPQGATGEPKHSEIAARNARLSQAAKFIRTVARERKHTAIDLHSPLALSHYKNSVILNEAGHREVAVRLAHALGLNRSSCLNAPNADSVIFGEDLRTENPRQTRYGARFSLTLDQLPSVASSVNIHGDQSLYHNSQLVGSSSGDERGSIETGPDFEQAEALRRLIIQKNKYHRAKLRPINKTYIFLFRRYEMGHFAHELNEYDELVNGVEEEIAFARVPRPHRHEFRAPRKWRAPRDYPDHEVPKTIPRPNVAAELASFKVADGFQVNLFAKNPWVANPINLNWDARGRAWVSSSSTYPHPRPGQEPNDRIVILEDRDRDGVADLHTVFADGLLVPHSVLPAEGGAYVCSATELL
ncbi:MAG: LamG-like jellyroll fold domain-containing protein, partial [Planctomycetota bacterium]